MERLCQAGPAELDPTARNDFLDLAIFCAALRVRPAPPAAGKQARGEAEQVLREAEALLGPSPVLDLERAFYGRSKPTREPQAGVRSAWEYYALGRTRLRAGALKQAAELLDRAVRLEPQGLWPNYYQGCCAYRLGRYTDAVAAFSVCIGAAPTAAHSFYNRALAFDALGLSEPALRDYDQALRLDPTHADAALNRGMLHYRAARYEAALTDLERASVLGSNPALVAPLRFLVNLARGVEVRNSAPARGSQFR
jgi:tetratricopeptide (TPR) repeat protein